MKYVTRTVLAVLIVVMCLTSCASPQGTVVASGSSAFPTNTLTDWVTYGDYLVIFKVESERRLEPPPEQRQRGEGIIDRQIEGRIVEKVWTSSSPWTKNAPKPSSMTVSNGGWSFHGDKEQPWRVDGVQELLPGSSYLALIAFSDTSWAVGDSSGQPEWILLEALPLEQGAISKSLDSISPKVSNEFAGKSPLQAGRVLEDTPPDAQAKPFMAEDPSKRFQDTAASR